MELRGMNRTLQREILIKLEAAYPKPLSASDLGSSAGDPEFTRAIAYLAEHSLVKRHLAKTPYASIDLGTSITAAGLDFLADDGGLTAVLGVVTVRFEAETLRALLAAKVDSSAMPEEEKSRIRKWLASVGEEGLKTATTRLVDAALDQVPDAFQWLLAAAS
jgi:hypothetical protein